jgi:hypothetical protein
MAHCSGGAGESASPDSAEAVGTRNLAGLSNLLLPSVQHCGWALSMAGKADVLPGVQWVLDGIAGMQAEVCTALACPCM